MWLLWRKCGHSWLFGYRQTAIDITTIHGYCSNDQIAKVFQINYASIQPNMHRFKRGNHILIDISQNLPLHVLFTTFAMS